MNVDLLAKDLHTVAVVLTIMFGGGLLSAAVGITLYIFQALGLYTVAMRRCIRHPWMAWLPVTDMWLLGSISDQYRYVACGQIRNRRKVLVGFCIALAILTLVTFGSYMTAVVKLIVQIPNIITMTPQKALSTVTATLLGVVGISIVLWVLSVVAAVFRYVCVYDLYASCIPNYKVLFLVLSILFPVAMPILIFVCRNKDQGMPPRKDAVVPDPEEEIFVEEPKNEEPES